MKSKHGRLRARLGLLTRHLRALPGVALPMGIALLLTALTLFKPTWQTDRPGYDFVVVVDITQSMNVPDYVLDGRPVSRLVFAKAALRRTLRELPCGSRLGWAVFTEFRVLLLVEPIDTCSNYHELLATLDQIDGRMAWANGSEIAKGLFWSLRTIHDIGGQHNLVFMTDGHEAPPLNPNYRPAFVGSTSPGKPYTYLDQTTWQQRMVYEGKPGDIHGLIVGVGGDEQMPIPKFDNDGRSLGYWQAHDVMQTDVYSTQQLHAASGGAAADSAILPTLTEHLSSLRENHLRELAQDGALRYHRLGSISGFTQALTAAEFSHPVRFNADLRPYFAALALLILVLIHRGRLRTLAARGQALSRRWLRTGSQPIADSSNS